MRSGIVDSIVKAKTTPKVTANTVTQFDCRWVERDRNSGNISFQFWVTLGLLYQSESVKLIYLVLFHE